MDAPRDTQSPMGASTQDSQTQPTQPLPDIDRILAELAGYSSNASSDSAQPVQGFYFQPAQQSPWPETQTPAPAVRRKEITPPAPTASPMIDPASIFDWPSALRCVNKITVSNPQFEVVVRGMIADQERNVKQWWEDRVSLIKTQEMRIGKINDLNEVLKSIGGELQAGPTPEEDQVELTRFDLKVYKASQQMARVHSLELKKVGVPFFGVNPKHIIANELQQTVAARDPMSQARITEAELVELQKKMVQFLEDMYRD